MRYVFRFGFALALGLVLMAGCSEENGEGGSGGTAGTGGMGGEGGTGGTVACLENVCACTEAGILAAIAEGGGPFTFDCSGPTTVVTEAEIVIDNDVILDGGGNLTLDGNEDHDVFSVDSTAELDGFAITKGNFGIRLEGGTLTLVHTTVSQNRIGILLDLGNLTLINTTVSDNHIDGTSAKQPLPPIQVVAGGITILGLGQVTLINSTVSGNTSPFPCNGIVQSTGSLTLISSTISGHGEAGLCLANDDAVTLRNTIVDSCSGFVTSLGHNIESPGNTCGFDEAKGDLFDITAEQLNLGPLQDNGGPTMTHALLPGSVAIDQIPAVDCVDADGAPLTTDQRGEPRPETGGTMCDVGAFELQP